MPELDNTDLQILRLLVANARRPYSEIADRVGVSPPTVSDRIDRLQDLGVVRRFTVDVDRETLDAGIEVLIEVETEPGATDDVTDRLARRNVVEHTYTTADGTVRAHATVPEDAVSDVLAASLDTEDVQSYDVQLVTDHQWTPAVAGTAFGVECTVCGTEVGSQGETVELEETIETVCSSECRERLEAEGAAVAAE